MSKILARLTLVALISLGSIPGVASADIFGSYFKDRDLSQFYYGVGVGDGTVEVNGVGQRSMGALTGSFGLRLINLVGVELQVGTASDDAQSILSESQITYAAGMLRAGVQIGRVGVYGLFGQALLDSSSQVNFSKSGNALGLGMNLFGTRRTSLNIHFLRLDGGEFTNASIGFQYFFGGY